MAKRCCPNDPISGLPLTYIDPTGQFFNVCSGTYDNIVSWTDGPLPGVYGKCVFVQCAPAGYGPAYDPMDCPCCPTGYTWLAGLNACVNPSDLKDRVDPIPCVVCAPCPTPPPPPPPCVGCNEDHGVQKSFDFNNTIKNCTECQTQGEPEGLGNGADGFMPVSLLDPIINFIFRT